MPWLGPPVVRASILQADMTATDLPINFVNVQISAASVTILNIPQLSISSGAPTLVIGPNGAGKSTLLRAAMGLVQPSNGSITWNGREADRSHHRAMLFQHSALLRRSAKSNLRFALRVARVPYRLRASRAEELLDLVNLNGLGERPARRLSGGEQRRLALARTLALNPSLLILDEPTANIDPSGTKAIESLILQTAAQGVKIIMSTHDLGQAKRIAGEIVMLNRGKIVEQSPADAFFDRPTSKEAKAFLVGDLLA